MTKKIIIVGLVLILIILIVLTALVSKMRKEGGQTGSPISLPFLEKTGGRATESGRDQTADQNSSKNHSDRNQLTKTHPPASKIRFRKKLKILTKNEREALDQFKKTLPYETENFKIVYSDYLEKFVVQLKTDQGKDAFSAWMTDKNNLLQNWFKNDAIVSREEPGQIEKYFYDPINNISMRQATRNEENIPSPTPIPYTEIQKKMLSNYIMSFYKTVNNVSNSEISGPPEKNSKPIQPQPTRQQTITKESIDLYDLFNEVGRNIGIPTAILAGVMHIEYPSTFALSPKEIAKYSAPGGIIPGCAPNVCSATGPMQITVGIDGSGSSSCPSCCWNGKCLDRKGGCPDQWRLYGTAVDVYGGGTHTPNPCNMRDNIYAAALKLKRDSGTAYPNNWSKDDVYRAARSYYGNCTVKYKRLDDRTYCEYVWWYYNNH